MPDAGRFGRRYRVIDKIGEGSFAEVFLVEDRLRGTELALKAFETSATGIDPRTLLQGEFLVLARFEHVGLPRVYDISVDPRHRPFFTLDYLRGPNVVAGLRGETGGPLRGQRAESVVAASVGILAILRYIHARGVVHGDLKPSNILYRFPLDPDDAADGVVLVDFGLHLPHARARGVSGTLSYLAPEVLAGGPPSPQGDLFSLGVILYEILAGQNPFIGMDPMLRARGLVPPVVPLLDIVPAIPRGFAETIGRLLASDVVARYRSADEARRALLLTSGWSPTRIARSLREGFRCDPGDIAFRAPLEQVRAAVGRLADGHGGTAISVAGASGSGLDRFARQARVEALSRGCRFMSLEVVAEPVKETIDRLAGTLAASQRVEPRGEAVDTPSAGEVAMEPAEQQRSQAERCEHWFRSLSGAASEAQEWGRNRPPLVLMLGRCDRATPALRAFLAYLARKQGRLPHVLLLGGRPGAWQAEVAATVSYALEPLSDPDIEEIVRDNFPGLARISPLAQLLHERSNGTLDVLVSLAGALVREGVVRPTADGWRVETTRLRSVQLPAAAVEDTLERWTPRDGEDRTILHALATLGGRGDPRAVVAVTRGLTRRVLPRLEDLAMVGLLSVELSASGEPVYRLDVPDLAKAIVHRLPRREQRDLARRAAAHLERRVAAGEDALLEPLASLELAIGRRQQAADRYARLGARWSAHHDPERALEAYRLAIQLRRGGRLRIPLAWLEAQLDLMLATGTGEAAATLARRLYDQRGAAPERRAALAFRAGLAAQQVGVPALAREWFERALALSGSAPWAAAVDAARALARIDQAEGRHAEAEVRYEEAAQRATRAGTKRRDLLLRVLMGLGEVRLARGDRDGARRCFERCRTLARRKSLAAWLPRVELGLGELLLEASPLEAQQYLEQAATGAAARGDPLVEAWARYNLGIVLGDLGHYEAAGAAYVEARELFVRCGRWEQARAEAQLGHLAREQGDLALCRSHYERFEALACEMPPEHPSRLMLRLNRWQLGLAEGQAGVVLAESTEAAAAFPPTHPRSHLAWRWIVAQARRDVGDLPAATVEATELLRRSRAAEHRSLAIAALLLLGELALARTDRDLARRHAEQARADARRDGGRVLAARAELLLAECAITARRAGDDPIPFLDAAEPVFARARLRSPLVRISALRARWKELRLGDERPAEPAPPKGLRTLYRAAEIIRSGADLTEVLENLLDAALDLMGAERGLVLLKSPTTRRLELQASRGGDRAVLADASRISQTILRQTLAEARAILSSNAQEDPRFRDNKSVVNFGIRSFVCAPLLLPDRAIGTLYLDHRHAERAFNAADAEFLMAFAGFAAVTIDNALRQGRVLRRAKQLAREVEFLWDPAQIVAVSAVMGRVLADIRRVAPGTATVLVRGESGTGKELVARMLHGCSDRAEEPFVVVNCAAIPAGLVESELFGVVRGAATDVVDRAGKFEDAHGGTLFLDEIGELPAAAQAKILRAIQERCVDRIGGTQSIPVDFRLVAATNADLETALDAGTFRRDLYYRLRVIEITIPPLRDRREDIAPLIAYYVDHFSQALNRPKPEISERALRSYLAYAWPGNVRELRNAVERAVLFAEGTTLPELGAAASGVDVSLTVDGAFAARLSEREMRNRYARHVYEQLGRNKLRTCAFLGIDFKTLQQRLTPSA